MKMIVGLGNPGKQYDKTRHNIGFMVIDAIATEKNLTFKHDKNMQAEIASFIENGEKILLVKPQTFMNESGKSLWAIKGYYQIQEADTLIIYDDLDLATGKVRLRYKGSAGGHNGIKSIIQNTKWQAFPRIKIGIGRPKAQMTVVNHVLGKFDNEEMEILEPSIAKAVAAALDFANGETFEQVMTNYN